MTTWRLHEQLVKSGDHVFFNFRSEGKAYNFVVQKIMKLYVEIVRSFN